MALMPQVPIETARLGRATEIEIVEMQIEPLVEENVLGEQGLGVGGEQYAVQ
jgi:hypothetical protein